MEPCRGRHISVNRFYHLPFRSGRLFHPGISKQAEPIRQKDPPQERRSCTICSFSIFCRRGVVVVQFSRLPILPPSPPHLQYPLRHNVLRGRPTPNCWNKWFTKRWSQRTSILPYVSNAVDGESPPLLLYWRKRRKRSRIASVSSEIARVHVDAQGR